jgi:hypothetical protein
MLTESRRTDANGPFGITVFSCAEGDSLVHPDQTKSYALPSYAVQYEEITPNSTKDHSSWKSFEHYKCSRGDYSQSLADSRVNTEEWQYLPHYYSGVARQPRFGTTGYYLNGNGVLPFGEPGFPIAGLPLFYEKREDGGFIPAPLNYDELEQMFMRQALPGIIAEMSLINNIIELRDFSSLPQTLRSIYSLFRHSIGTLRRILRATSDGYLQAQFNILPLLSDITGIHAGLVRTERRMNDLITRMGRVQRRHFVYNWREFADTVDEESDAYFGYYPFSPGLHNQLNAFYLRRSCVCDNSQFHAMIEYNYNFTRYQLEHARVLSLLDTFGVNFNPAIIWNAIPWSFVVDWVFGVSRWLDSMKTQNMAPQTNILRYLWSIKRRRTILTTKKGLSLHVSYPPFGLHVPQPAVIETAYRRHVTMPSVSSIESSGVSFHELTLGAALVTARRRRHR